MSMVEDKKLQGLCKECIHRNSCQDAKRHLNMIECSEYKNWKKLILDYASKVGIGVKQS